MSRNIKITSNSIAVQPGDTFVAIEGFTVDGHDFIEKAIENGASRIVCERGSYSVETILVENSRKWLNDTLVENYSKAFDGLCFVGITGTNGKTTSAYLASQMINALGRKCAYIGTIGFYVNNELVRMLNNTTPDILTTYELILESKNMGAEVIVLEISSHALHYGRINGIKLDIAAFTNLTEDHLDFHKTMEAYLETKVQITNYLKPEGVMIVNADDEAHKAFKADNVKKIALVGAAGIKDSSEVSFGPEDYLVKSFEYGLSSTNMLLTHEGRDYEISMNLLNRFNLYNYTMATAIANTLGYTIDDIARVSRNVYPPSGRNEIIELDGAKAIIDYAHTPDAVEQIIIANRESTDGMIVTIIGCGGDRDQIKRPIMGEIASRLSDYVVFTDDNPRTEDHEKIVKDILAGVTETNYEVELDRAKAIRKGMEMLKPGDALLILGKGHEDYQIIGHEKIHFSDKEQVLKYKNR